MTAAPMGTTVPISPKTAQLISNESEEEGVKGAGGEVKLYSSLQVKLGCGPITELWLWKIERRYHFEF